MRQLGHPALFGLIFLGGVQGQLSMTSYPIRPSADLKITVMGEPDLLGWATVQTEGSIIFPLLGSIQVAGLTAKELQQTLVKELTRFVQNRSVNVEVISGPKNDTRKWLSPPKKQPYSFREPYPVGMVLDSP